LQGQSAGRDPRGVVGEERVNLWDGQSSGGAGGALAGD
jgi:hypothetical protein